MTVSTPVRPITRALLMRNLAALANMMNSPVMNSVTRIDDWAPR
jgi:hypothetical protein